MKSGKGLMYFVVFCIRQVCKEEKNVFDIVGKYNVIFGYSMVVGDCSPHVLSLENL